MSGTARLAFSVDAQLVGELGERLVARGYLALAELIKNAYDADATEVTVTLRGASRGGTTKNDASIVVSDNGTGMSRDAVESVWMRIATAAKIREPLSPIYGRARAGNKGIGRFACQRLARELLLDTVCQNKGTPRVRSTVRLHWADFTPGRELSEVRSPATFESVPEGTHQGTRLELKDLRDAWTDAQFRLLQRQLLSIAAVPPKKRRGYAEDPGFKIEVASDEFQSTAQRLDAALMDAGWGRLVASVGASGELVCELDALGMRRRTHTFARKYDALSGMQLDVALIPNEKTRFRNPSLLTTAVARQVAAESSGVHVFLDGFRVYPYGDANDDWLGLSRDVARRLTATPEHVLGVAKKLGLDTSRAMLNLPRSQNLLGSVALRSDRTRESALVPKIDREGFVENEAYEELQAAVRTAIDWMALHYELYLRKESERELENASRPFVEGDPEPDTANAPVKAERLFSALAKQTSGDSEAVSRQLPQIRAAAKVLVASQQVLADEIAALRIAASAAPVLLTFVHEVRTLLGRLATHANTIELAVDSRDGASKARLTKVAADLRSTRELLDSQVSLYGDIAGATRARAENVSVREIVGMVVRALTSFTDRYELKIDYDQVDEDAVVHDIRRGEVVAVVVNGLSNAIKATLAGSGHAISVRARSEKRVVIEILDDGIGVPDDLRESLFRSYDADRAEELYRKLASRLSRGDRTALGTGTGLGLSIIRGIAAARGGNAEFKDATRGWKTCLQVTL